jgi:tetratricopeptide (TPR) repeat protein
VTDKFKYKAFISYSHRDERWASWLHRSLESYRLPRKLVGTKTAVGEVPARIKPVFRDRDELSSSGDLGSTVQQALADSENLIVICSPASAASFWVNEEIRYFAGLGRSERIFCVIVDGEPGGVGTKATCFPEALEEVGLTEPLAADLRKWADGKHLSKLKLVAGMLGLPLDQLRRRDLQKRQRAWGLASVAAIALAAVLVTAVTARIAAEQRRDSGESLVAYKLSELRTMLNVTEDPEDLSRLQQWSPQELGQLISDNGQDVDALMAAAMTLREQGMSDWYGGVLSEAMAEFEQSWALLAEIYRRDRDNRQVFFELGQTEYWIGQTHLDLGNLVEAEKAWMSYAEITRRLILLESENAEWVMEMSYALTNLGELQKSRDADNPERTLQFMQSSLEYNQIALVLDPSNEYYRSELGQSHAFLVDAQMGVCDLEGALITRQEHVALEKELLNAEPDNSDRVKFMAFALTGYALVNQRMGDVDAAMDNLERAVQLLEQSLRLGANVRKTKIDLLQRQQRLMKLTALKGETTLAWSMSKEISEKWTELEAISEEDMRNALIYVQFLIDRASIAAVNGESEIAQQLLTDIQLHLAAAQSNMSFRRKVENMLVRAVFEQWEISRKLPPADILSALPDFVFGSGRSRACADAGNAVRKAVMFNQVGQARKFTEYLLDKGYREPGFMRVCRQYFLCPGQ